FLALDLAVAVAAGVPCLRRFAVPRAGRVLLFAAEDALHIVRRRLEGIEAAASVALANLDIQVKVWLSGAAFARWSVPRWRRAARLYWTKAWTWATSSICAPWS